MRYAVLAAALCSLPLIAAAADNEWHITCEPSGACSYRQDGPEHSHLARRKLEDDTDDSAEEDVSVDLEYYDTRCSPDPVGHENLIERWNGTHWVHHFDCPILERPHFLGTCVDLHGRGACNQGNGRWVVPGKYLFTIYECGRYGVWSGCDKLGETSVLNQPPANHKRDVPREDGYYADTRCHPGSDSWIQYFNRQAQTWNNFMKCPPDEMCWNEEGSGGCGIPGVKHVKTMVWIIRNPTDESNTVVDPVREDMVTGTVQTRCDPADPEHKRVQYLDDDKWQGFYECSKKCEQKPQFAACLEQTDKYLVPAPTLPADPTPAPAPVSQVYSTEYVLNDTRCNPKTFSDVQRFNGEDWNFAYTCTIAGACEDVDGHGFCHGWYPPHFATSCNKNNNTEVLQWTGAAWIPFGACVSPLICEQAASGIDSAACRNLTGNLREIWSPWPLVTQRSSAGDVTRCIDPATLYRFNGKNWVPFRYCGTGFRCEGIKDETGTMHGGCVANVDAGMKQVRRDLAATEDPDHYEPFGFAHGALPDTGLIEDSQKLLFQGEGLIDEGKELIEHGDDLYESLYGTGKRPGKSPADPSPSKQKAPADHHSARSLRARDEPGLVGDSREMHRQGERLVVEGTLLVEKGREILHTIFGDRTDNVVQGLTGPKTGPAAKKSLNQRDVDVRALDSHCHHACSCGQFPSEKCDRDCRQCIARSTKASGAAKRSASSCLECNGCETWDLKCHAKCMADCVDDD